MENTPLNQASGPVDDLIRLVRTLRGKNGCPWDKKQTPQSVSKYLIEEVYELVDAIESDSAEQVCEELGDVLFHLVFIARMFEEKGKFNLSRASRSITEKMIRRHPHVFGNKEVNSSAEISRNWHKIKLAEKKGGDRTFLLESVPLKLPALIRAYRISDRAAKSGLEWTELDGNSNHPGAFEEEFPALLKDKDRQRASRKFGDLLFYLINAARLADIHPEEALSGSVKKFEARVKKVEEIVADSGREFDNVSVEEKKRIWRQVQKSIP